MIELPSWLLEKVKGGAGGGVTSPELPDRE